MRYSEMLIPTLKEVPAEAEVISHKLMVKGGYIRKIAAGIYTYLPLALRVLRKIENIIREEMNAVGAQELLLPIVLPAELWQETGRWDIYGKELLRFKDRHERDFCIGPTHEEAITDLVRKEVRSYRDLPKNLYQIQTKFRDEVRPRFGLMRGREFLMKDAYSFDLDEASSMRVYRKMYDAYKRIFVRCGLEFKPVEAMTGTIGGTLSHEFQVLAASGEDEIVSCTKCEYAANVERAELPNPQSAIRNLQSGKKGGNFKVVDTPGKKSVEDVTEFLNVRPQDIVKTLVFETDKGPVAGLVRGDYSIKESKLKELIGCKWCHLAEEEVVKKITGAPSGFSGPIGLKIPIYADYSVALMEDFVVGANAIDKHIVNVNLSDFEVAETGDIRRAVDGDPCPRCGGRMREYRGIEVGQIFYLGTKYSKSMNAFYLDEKGKRKEIVMGCYGIGIGRTAAAAIEQNHDEKGIIWPLSIAPFHVEIIELETKKSGGEVRRLSERLYKLLNEMDVEVLYDDRDERPGVKFADADLIGIPFHVVVGAKGLREGGKVEFKERKTGKVVMLTLDETLERIKKEIKDGTKGK